MRIKIGYLEIRWDPRRAKVLRKLRQSTKIQAIKLTRELTGWGLKESKEYVDRICLEENLNSHF